MYYNSRFSRQLEAQERYSNCRSSRVRDEMLLRRRDCIVSDKVPRGSRKVGLQVHCGNIQGHAALLEWGQLHFTYPVLDPCLLLA